MKIRALKPLALIAFSCVFGFGPLDAVGGGWGIERGRADAGDAARLLVDQLTIKMVRNRIDEAITRPLASERQRQLLGISNDSVRPDELTDAVYEWWIKDVMRPAEAVAGNPAASCAEAMIAVQTLLEMMKQRALLGLETEEFTEMFNSSRSKVAKRCREEALDECVATGRFEQIIQTELTLLRNEALLGGEGDVNGAWANDAFKQCAIYELHFVSTTKVPHIFNLEMVRDTKITLEFDAGPDGILGALLGNTKLSEILKGESKGGTNPFFISVKCSQPPIQIVCMAGKNLSPYRSRVFVMDLKHREFYVDAIGISRERTAGEDQFSFELAEGIYGVDAFVKVPNYPDVQVPMKAVGFAFYTAHKKDRAGETPGAGVTVKIERNQRGVYPVIFDFIYADQDSESNASASDSTTFKLIHKPKPKPLVRVEPTRKPLKPGSRIKSVGG